MSSMKIEFHEQADIVQACYEASVDIVRYVDHLKNIAERCEEHFPEIAAGLRGSAAGIAQYLRGVDGGWETQANVDLRGALSLPDFKEHMWAYEFCRNPRCAVVLMGCLAATAAAKPNLTFWEALAESRAKMSDLQPLIEKLLASSPMRRQGDRAQ
jgi:hypothetical protein